MGIHARPAAMIVRLANIYSGEVWVEKDGEEVNGKSIMGLMMLGASLGSEIILQASGPDADAAVAALTRLVEDKFDEV